MANSLKDKLAANAAIKGNGLDALLGKNPMDAMRVDDRRVQDIALSKLHPFNGHTFRVVKNSDYDSMVDSVRNSGVSVPLIVRPHPALAGDFEIIAGHRRFSAASDVGLKEVPCLVTNIDNMTASKIMVETNIQRPEWLPSEKSRHSHSSRITERQNIFGAIVQFDIHIQHTRRDTEPVLRYEQGKIRRVLPWRPA